MKWMIVAHPLPGVAAKRYFKVYENSENNRKRFENFTKILSVDKRLADTKARRLNHEALEEANALIRKESTVRDYLQRIIQAQESKETEEAAL